MVVDMQSPEMQKQKRENYPEYKKRYLNHKMKNIEWYCDVCKNGKKYSLRGKWSHLKTKKHERNFYAINPLIKEAINAFQKILSDRKSLREIVTEKDRALKNSVKSFQVAIIERGDPAKQLYVTTIDVERKLDGLLQREKGLKVYVTLHIKFKKRKIEDGEDVFEFKNAYFNSKTSTITNSDQIIDALDQASEDIKNGVAVWLSEGSGWTIEAILQHYVNIVKYVPLRGNSYLPLPEELRNSNKSLINLKNEDDKCFLWCHVRHLNPQKTNPQRIKLSDRESAKGLDYSGITFPVSRKQIPQIEKKNNIKIRVYVYDGKAPYPIYVSEEKYPDHMELLYLDEGRYVYINDFNRLMFNFTKHKERKHFCMHCLQCFHSNISLTKHKKRLYYY